MRRRLNAVCCSALLLFSSASYANAQVERASLTGTVKDSSDAVVPGATVTARSVASDVPSQSISDAQGAFIIGGLIPGAYIVEVELAGIQKRSRRVDLDTGSRTRVDFSLSLGAVEQNITVVGLSPLMNTEQSTLGTVISQPEVRQLPLSLRNWDDLIGLAPGVQGDRYTEQAGSTAAGRTGGVNVHGMRSLANNFLLDGLDNNSIPADRIDPVARQIMDLFPLPNATGPNNYFRVGANTTDDSQRYLLRGDGHLSASDNIFGRFFYSDRDRFIPGNYGGIADGTSTSARGRQN